MSGVLTMRQIEEFEEKKQDIVMEAKYPRIHDPNIISLAEELTTILRVNFNEIFKAETFNILSKIAFLPCKIPSMRSNIVREDNVIPISLCRPMDALLEKDYVLSWTVAPVVTVKMPEMGLQHLCITSPPPIDVVIAHCLNLSKVRGGLDGWMYRDDPVEVFDKIISFLNVQFRSDKVTKPHITTLSNTPFIPIGSSLLKPSRLFMSMDGGDLSPFMFTVPRQFQSYEKLFKVLGTKEKPSISDYHQFLLELAAECGSNKPLNINELNAVCDCW